MSAVVVEDLTMRYRGHTALVVCRGFALAGGGRVGGLKVKSMVKSRRLRRASATGGAPMSFVKGGTM